MYMKTFQQSCPSDAYFSNSNISKNRYSYIWYLPFEIVMFSFYCSQMRTYFLLNLVIHCWKHFILSCYVYFSVSFFTTHATLYITSRSSALMPFHTVLASNIFSISTTFSFTIGRVYIGFSPSQFFLIHSQGFSRSSHLLFAIWLKIFN